MAWVCFSLSKQDVCRLSGICFFSFFFLFAEWLALFAVYSFRNQEVSMVASNGNDELPTVYCSSKSCKLKTRVLWGSHKRDVLGSRGEFRRKYNLPKFQKLLLQVFIKQYQFNHALLTFIIVKVISYQY